MYRNFNATISALGGGSVTYQEQTLPLTKTELSIVITLALHSQPLSSFDILYDVWADHKIPRCGEKNIPPYIYSIRKKSLAAFNYSIISSRNNHYCIDSSIEFKDYFELLEEYQELVILSTTQTPVSTVYDKVLKSIKFPFTPVLRGLEGKTINAYRDSYYQICHNLISIKFDAALTLGRQKDILPEVRALYNLDKSNEKYALQLINCLTKENKRNEAFGVFFECKESLSDTFGVDVCNDLKQVYLSLIS